MPFRRIVDPLIARSSFICADNVQLAVAAYTIVYVASSHLHVPTFPHWLAQPSYLDQDVDRAMWLYWGYLPIQLLREVAIQRKMERH